MPQQVPPTSPKDTPADTPVLEATVPLCVDLDGTLIASDLLWESFFAMVRSHPADVLRVPQWLLRGRAALKDEISRRGAIDPALLPYRPEVVSFLSDLKASDRRVILTTASNERLAHAVAEHHGFFDDVIASDSTRNLKGDAKRDELVRRFGERGFDYMGDSSADLPVWRAARRSYAVGASPKVLEEARRSGPVEEVTTKRRRLVKGAVKAMRPHQWAKNSLLLVPLLTSHQFFDRSLVLRALIGILAFSLSASAVYILNDLLDLQADRRHRTKRRRPFAAGDVPLPTGLALAFGLLIFGVGSSLVLPLTFVGLLLLYLVMTTAYSVYLKRKLMVDVLCLAGLYTLRILAGGAAISVPITAWLLAFSMFLFLSLAFAKRFTEVEAASDTERFVAGRGYGPSDRELIQTMGPCCGLLSVLVLCLYINNPDIRELYRRPEALWLACPVLLYWISRVWFLACRRELADDPVLFAIRDRISHLAGIVLLVILAISIWG